MNDLKQRLRKRLKKAQLEVSNIKKQLRKLRSST